ncbi:MAG: glycoside hydrolase family 95 protein [Bacteroidales bacterium]|nr:glycoside hydrolase family 95 protein [Bacteroidales bacterium]
MNAIKPMILSLAATVCALSLAAEPYRYHFDNPAGTWEECLPQGNGRLGVMADGGTNREKVVLNEISMWSGSRQDTDNPDAIMSIGEIRRLLFEGKNDEAQALMYKTFTPKGVGSNGGKAYERPYGCYQLFGNLRFDYDMEGDVSGYRRELDLATAISTTTYSQGGTDFRRESFVSYSDDVAVIRYTASHRGALGFSIRMDRKSNIEQRPSWDPVCRAEKDVLLYHGRLCAGTEAPDEPEAQGTRYMGKVKVILPKGGDLSAEGDCLKVANASEVIVLVGMATDYLGGESFAEMLDRQVADAARRSFRSLRRRHIREYSELFGRVEVDFGHNHEREALPMDRRLAAFDRDHEDPSLPALYYQFGRYLLISGTRPGTLPPNLQGLWAYTIKTPWNGDYHLNINLEMNYWPMESGNLGGLHRALTDWVKSQVESGRHTARVFYNARGWVTHTLGNLWQYTCPGEGPSWGATNTCAAWLCQQLYRHWQYAPDRDYLEEIYPIMKEAALFFVDMLVEDPGSGYLVTAPTTSPENSFYLPNGNKANVVAGSTMDNQIIRELFTNVVEAAGVLGDSDRLCDTLSMMKARLKPTTIGDDGRIMEWMEPYPETARDHRHVSHLYGLYPGDEISMTRTPALAEAARRSLIVRGDVSTGWSMAWKINFWARLHDGEHAYKLLTDLLHPAASTGTDYNRGGGSYPNLFCAHPPFQIDGNLGGAAGIAEMLVQSHEGFIELLPALPAAMKDGSFRGLAVRGGAVVSADWKDGRLTKVRLKATHDGEFFIKGVTDAPVRLAKGRTKRWKIR